MYDVQTLESGLQENTEQPNLEGKYIHKLRSLYGRRAGYKVTKRTFDIIASGLVIGLCAGPGLLLALFISYSTGGSPIYSQIRVGKYGKQFKIYKLRTMVVDSDNVEKYFTKEQLETWHRERKVENDPRVTRLGRVLRATSIDELPNFINVLLGQMSVVGPRAITVDELAWYGESARRLVSVLPGVTGLWQATQRNSATYETGARQTLELKYVENASIRLDARIVCATFLAVTRLTGK